MSMRPAIDRGIVRHNAPPVPPSDTPTLPLARALLWVRQPCAWCGSSQVLEEPTSELGPGRVYCAYGCGRVACWIADERCGAVGVQPESQNPIAVRRREREES